MLIVAMLEDEDELVLTAIQRAHPGIVLDPNADIFELAKDLASGGCQLIDVAPIHAEINQRSLGAECREVATRLTEKGDELGSIHLARRHRKGAMMDRAQTGCVTGNWYIVGRVGERHRGVFVAHQRRKSRCVERTAA